MVDNTIKIKDYHFESIEVIIGRKYINRIGREYTHKAKSISYVGVQEHEVILLNPGQYEEDHNLIVVTFSKYIYQGKKEVKETIACPISEFQIFQTFSGIYTPQSRGDGQCFLYKESHGHGITRNTYFDDGCHVHLLDKYQAMLVWKHYLHTEMYTAEEFDELFQEAEAHVNNLNLQEIIDGYTIERDDHKICRPGKDWPYYIYEYYKHEEYGFDDPYILSFLPSKSVELYSDIDVSYQQQQDAIKACGGLGRDQNKEEEMKGRFWKSYDRKVHIQRLVFKKIQDRSFEVNFYNQWCRACDYEWGINNPNGEDYQIPADGSGVIFPIKIEEIKKNR